MSDVLTNIIARSAAPLTTVRPLYASLYAPDGPGAAQDAGLIEQEDVVGAQPDRPATAQHAAQPPIHADQQADRLPMTAAQHAAQSVQLDQHSERSPMAALDRAEPSEDERHPQAERGTAAAFDAALVDRLIQRALIGARPVLLSPPPRETLVERLEMVREAAPAFDRPESHAPVMPEVRPAAPIPPPAPEVQPIPPPVPEVQPIPLDPPQAAERIVERTTERTIEAVPPPLPVVTPRPPLLPPLPEAPRARTVEIIRETSTPAAPTIQVSIGRIEVRAQPAAQTKRHEAPRPAVMTLDEYLRQREGGAR